jgi:uncharacterized protein
MNNTNLKTLLVPTCGLLLVWTAAVGLAGAQDELSTREALEREIAALSPAANGGDAQAQYELGGLKRLEQSLGLSDDFEFATWYRRAADQGLAAAQNILGQLYRDGEGVARDYAEANRWYRLAADQGNMNAQLSLGDLYRDGIGVAQDHSEAARWYRLAADGGNGVAQFDLADLYIDGLGVPQDRVQAYMWLSLAVTHWPVPETNLIVQLRDLIAADLTDEEVRRARRLAQEWEAQ